MDVRTRLQLQAINRRFYSARAREFSASRNHPWPGFARVLEHIDRRARVARGEPLRLLDVGCGNGRFAAYLAEQRSLPCEYLGVDASPELLAHARDVLAKAAWEGASLCELDVLRPEPGAALPPGPFDAVVAFGLLHHVPGSSARRALIEALADRVAPGGLLALTAWRFGADPRFERGRIDWAAYNDGAETPVDLSQLEPNDWLLGFSSDQGDAAAPAGPGMVRYCHYTDDAELARLLRGLEARRIESFDADGRSGDLNRYVILER